MTASEQIRIMLSSRICQHMTDDEWQRLDAVMHSQREKHGPEATAWWFEGQRGEWWCRAQRAGQGGSVGR